MRSFVLFPVIVTLLATCTIGMSGSVMAKSRLFGLYRHVGKSTEYLDNAATAAMSIAVSALAVD